VTKLIDAEDCVSSDKMTVADIKENDVRKIGKMMFDDADVKTNLDAMKNDEVRNVNAKQDDKIDVAMESVEVIIAEENNVMVDNDMEKSVEDEAAEAKDVKSGENEVDELKLLHYDKYNVDKMKFADAYTEKDDMIDVDVMGTEKVYGMMDFN